MTKPDGIYVPFSYIPNLASSNRPPQSPVPPVPEMSASSSDIVNTLHLLVGIGSTCVLNQANLTMLDLLSADNKTGSIEFNQRYFGNSDWCRVVFNQNCDIDDDYFPIGESSSMVQSFLKKVNLDKRVFLYSSLLKRMLRSDEPQLEKYQIIKLR
jgi:hypothetical protein